jgi:hypothetical protein
VMVNHWGGLWRTEYRHMDEIVVNEGDKVQRGDRLGSIGGVNGTDTPFPTHLHHVHWTRNDTSQPFSRTKQSFYGEPVRTSVWNSDSQNRDTWNPPERVMIEGPAPKATWESAFKELEAKYTTLDTKYTAAKATITKLRADIAAMPPADAVLQAELADLEVQFDNLEDQFTELKTKWSEVGSALDNLVDVYGE